MARSPIRRAQHRQDGAALSWPHATPLRRGTGTTPLPEPCGTRADAAGRRRDHGFNGEHLNSQRKQHDRAAEDARDGRVGGAPRFLGNYSGALFAADFKRQPEEPGIALCGLDNAAGRRALDQVGSDLVIEAGLGRRHRNLRAMRLHLLPGRRPAAEMWKAAAGGEQVEVRPACAQLIAEGVLDCCGMTLLAGRAAGAPCVGSVAACLALSQMLRLLHDGELYGLIDLDLLSPEQCTVCRYPGDFSNFNPGFSMAG